MIRVSGTKPEDLPPAEDIRSVRASLKKTHRSLKKIDQPRGVRLAPVLQSSSAAISSQVQMRSATPAAVAEARGRFARLLWGGRSSPT